VIIKPRPLIARRNGLSILNFEITLDPAAPHEDSSRIKLVNFNSFVSFPIEVLVTDMQLLQD
jgi:hypothetical protein